MKKTITGMIPAFRDNFSRRKFLEYQLKGLLYIAAGSSGLFAPGKLFANPEPDIAVVKGGAAEATRAAVELMGGMKKFVKKGDKVLIKPNMSFPNLPTVASTTNPDVVKTVALMCREAGAENIIIADYPLKRSEFCLKRSGILDACEKVEGTTVIGATSDRLYQDTDFPGAKKMNRNGVLKEALKADVLIAVPVAKSHSGAAVSLSMKGMMGLVWDRAGMHTKGLTSTIVDMCSVLKADLTIIDGIRVLSTNGPGGPGKVLNENTIIVSKDMVAADSFAVSRFKWSGRNYKAHQVPYIREAHERGLGRMDIENLTVKEIAL